MKTIRDYQIDVYKKESEAKVIDIIREKNKILIITDKTIFFPEGGGQPSDIGYINDCPVHHVSEKGDTIYHHTNGNLGFETGDTVNLKINWARRFENMQAHLGEHILSGTFSTLYGGVNRGFHMGENYITIDISLEKDLKYTEITWEMAMKAENLANNTIWENHPVTIKHFSNPKKAAAMKLRKELTLDADDISIVTVGDENAPKDCVACCGTHPKTSGEVGLIKIYKVEKNKGMFRIYFDCGIRAMRNYDRVHEIMTRISDKYSAGIEDLEGKILKEDAKNRDIRSRLSELVRTLVKERTDELVQITDKNSLGDANGCKVVYKKYQDFLPDDILKIDKELTKKPGILYALLSTKENTVILLSDGNIKCGNLVKEYANFYGGKGGGKPELARAIFKKESDAEMFIDLLEKHLKDRVVE